MFSFQKEALTQGHLIRRDWHGRSWIESLMAIPGNVDRRTGAVQHVFSSDEGLAHWIPPNDGSLLFTEWKMIMKATKLIFAIGTTCLLVAGSAFAGTFSNISGEEPTHLVASTGNVYWTSSLMNEFGPSGEFIWRTSKNAKPGEEQLLYSEWGTEYKPFGDIVYANVGAWYGYFIVNDQSASLPVNYSSVIKRIPLAGGTAVTIATLSRFVGNRSLRTDGKYLYWVDTDGIRKMPINGGTISTLATTTRGKKLELDANFVYFSDGGEIRRVLKTGSSTTVMASSSEPISALYIHPVTNGTRVFWGNEGGGVYSKDVGFTSVTTYAAPVSGYTTTSVGFDGTRVLWTNCTDSWSNCKVGIRTGTTTVYNVGVNINRNMFGHLQWDEKQVIWGSASGIHKLEY
jgi:hypothetical protein